MKFGVLKSKIEKKLVNSYTTNTLSEDLKFFKKNILENKKFSKLYFLYDELSSKKGIKNKEIANDFVNECIKIYENTINKVTQKEWNNIQLWVSNIKGENDYQNIDNLFNGDILQIESKIESKKTIIENLLDKSTESKTQVNLPLKTLVNVANNTINKHIQQLDETSRKELNTIMQADDNDLELSYKVTKEEVINKLNSLLESSDDETNSKILESINKIQSENYNKLNYFRLKVLNESI